MLKEGERPLPTREGRVQEKAEEGAGLVRTWKESELVKGLTCWRVRTGRVCENKMDPMHPQDQVAVPMIVPNGG
jgi:hypothetical protein